MDTLKFKCWHCRQSYTRDKLIWDKNDGDYICIKCQQRFKDEENPDKSLCAYCDEYFDDDYITVDDKKATYPSKICFDCFSDKKHADELLHDGFYFRCTGKSLRY
jgi:hypothetical protein